MFVMQHNEELMEVLNDLVRINNDRIEGYEKAISETKDIDADLRTLSPLFGPDFGQAISVEASLAARSAYGGTAPEAVGRALAEARALLETP